eukprot:10471666-Ditylum_brightwellii.AAC.1
MKLFIALTGLLSASAFVPSPTGRLNNVCLNGYLDNMNGASSGSTTLSEAIAFAQQATAAAEEAKSYAEAARAAAAEAKQYAVGFDAAPAAPVYEAAPAAPVAPAAPAASGPPKSYSPYGQKPKASAPQNAYMAAIS